MKTLNPKYSLPARRYFSGERFYWVGYSASNKTIAKRYAESLRKEGHKVRVVPRKDLFGKRIYEVLRNKY